MSEQQKEKRAAPPLVVPLSFAHAAVHNARTISFIDLEMSGGDAQRHAIIQAGGLLTGYPSAQEFRSFERKVKPRTLQGCQWRALRLAHFSYKDWRNAVGIYNVLRILDYYMEGRIVAGWDLSQDVKFIEAACQRTDRRYPRVLAYLDVQKWAQDRLNLPQRPSLRSVAAMLEIPYRQHDALEDTRATYYIFRHFWQYGPDEARNRKASLRKGRISLSRNALRARQTELLAYLRSPQSYSGEGSKATEKPLAERKDGCA
jgi:DNA polymerase III epsilon subunit-like protein